MAPLPKSYIRHLSVNQAEGAQVALIVEGGLVGRRVVTMSLACWLFAAALGAHAGEPVRLAIEEGDVAHRFSADKIAVFDDDRQRCMVMNGQFKFSAGQLKLSADRAVLWMERHPTNPKAVRGEIYAIGNVRGIKQIQPNETALLAFTTQGEIDINGVADKQTPADNPFLKEAEAIREGKPVVRQVQATDPPPPPAAAQPIRSPSGGVTAEPPVFESPTIPLPNVSTRKLKIGNRSSNPTNAKYLNMGNGEQIALVTGGVKLLATFEDRSNLILDVEADEVVIWQRGGTANELVEGMNTRDGITQTNEKETELYLSGNVVIRYGTVNGPRNPDGSPIEEKTLRADRVYYDVTRNKAIAKNADLEMHRNGFAVPAHYKGDEFWQLSAQEYLTRSASVAASKLPADPALDLRMSELRITEQRNQVERTIFGYPIVDRETGADVVGSYRRFRARNTRIELADVPIMYFPILAGDVDDPTGPLNNLFFRQDQVFGTQLMSTWSILELIGVKALPNERANLMIDYLSQRGFALGTAYDLAGPRLFGYEAPFNTHFLAYGLHDEGADQLGGTRNLNWEPPGYRGRALWRHTQQYENFSYQGQVSYLSDPNFLEQYYKFEFDMGPNQETFSYLKWQEGNLAATILAQPNLDRPWVTETKWLPRVDGYLLGQSFWDRLTYNTWASAGYANLQVYNLPFNQYPANIDPLTVPTPDYPLSTARLDWMQQIAAPFQAGFLKVVPYANLDLAYYSNDVNGDPRGRIYGGGGARVSMPLTRQYNDVESELFNLKGINHKVALVGNYYNAWSDTPHTLLPQLDRLNDDATQQAIRDITPWQTAFVPGPDGNMLFNSPLYDPRRYAIRRLVDTRADTLDSVQVVQGELRQRWQTKRGYAGMEHTIDYVTLDLSGSYFPTADRDNFGHQLAFLEYDATWAVGDRNGFTSSGWMDPFAFGTRYWNLNMYHNRPDGANLSLSYRHFEPVGSRQLSGAVNYMFSPKYAVTFFSAYDFGLSQNQSTGLILSRVGTDLTWSVGFSYNAIINNFGFNFMVVPNFFNPRGGSANTMYTNNSANGRN